MRRIRHTKKSAGMGDKLLPVTGIAAVPVNAGAGVLVGQLSPVGLGTITAAVQIFSGGFQCPAQRVGAILDIALGVLATAIGMPAFFLTSTLGAMIQCPEGQQRLNASLLKLLQEYSGGIVDWQLGITSTMTQTQADAIRSRFSTCFVSLLLIGFPPMFATSLSVVAITNQMATGAIPIDSIINVSATAVLSCPYANGTFASPSAYLGFYISCLASNGASSLQGAMGNITNGWVINLPWTATPATDSFGNATTIYTSGEEPGYFVQGSTALSVNDVPGLAGGAGGGDVDTIAAAPYIVVSSIIGETYILSGSLNVVPVTTNPIPSSLSTNGVYNIIPEPSIPQIMNPIQLLVWQAMKGFAFSAVKTQIPANYAPLAASDPNTVNAEETLSDLLVPALVALAGIGAFIWSEDKK